LMSPGTAVYWPSHVVVGSNIMSLDMILKLWLLISSGDSVQSCVGSSFSVHAYTHNEDRSSDMQ